MNKIFLGLLVFLYVFGPVFRPIGAWMDLIFVTSIFLSVYGIFQLKLKIPSYFNVLSLLIIVFSYCTISIITYNGSEFGDYIRLLLIPIRIYITMFGGYTLVVLFKRKFQGDYFTALLSMLYLSILIHGLIMIGQLFYPGFKEWIYLYTSSGVFRGTYEYDFRMGGLTGGSGDSVLSVVQSLGIIVIPWLYQNIKRIWKLPLIFGGILIFSTILLSGRSGVWGVLIFLPFSIYFASKSRGALFWVRSIGIMGIVSMLFALFFIVYDKVETESPVFFAISRSLDTFLEFRSSGSFDDHSVDALTNHLILPDNPFIWIFGNGEHLVNTQFQRTLDSDIGFIRNLWSMGIFIALLFWAPILYFAITGYKLARKFKPASLLFVLSLIMLLFHAKENYLYVRMFLSIYSLILFSLYCEVTHTENNSY